MFKYGIFRASRAVDPVGQTGKTTTIDKINFYVGFDPMIESRRHIVALSINKIK